MEREGLSVQARRGRRYRYTVVLAGLAAVLVALILLNISLGSVRIPIGRLPSLLLGDDVGSTYHSILWKIRLPRMISALVLGGALALSGFLLQTFFDNPIAGPYVLGISSGAKLTVACVMVGMLSAHRTLQAATLIGAAFVGSLLATALVLLVARRVERSSALIVSGVMIGYICSAITDFVVTFADDASIVNLHNWSRGSFSGASWPDVRLSAAVVLGTSVLVFLLSKPIGAYQMGERYAQNMGVNVRWFRMALVLLSSVLSACVTAFAGPVSFVGIAVPHLARRLLGTAKPIVMIPACFLGGAVFCLACDLIARTVFAPAEVSISSVTAVFGAPIVIAMLTRKRRPA